MLITEIYLYSKNTLKTRDKFMEFIKILDFLNAKPICF